METEMQEDTKQVLKHLAVRFLISLPFFTVGLLLMTPVAVISILGLILLVFASLLLIRPLTEILTLTSGSAIFPRRLNRKATLMFSIADTKIMHKEYDEALRQLKEMIPEDPDTLEIYTRIMKLAVNKMKQPEIAKDAFHEGLQNLTTQRDRTVLADTYKELML
jgi:hypothetical protein